MVLPPKPPPISAGMARMSLWGMPVKYAVMARTMNWPWLELQLMALSSAPTLTRQPFGDVSLLDLDPAADVGRLALELHEVVQDRRVGLDRVLDLDRPRQHLVI